MKHGYFSLEGAEDALFSTTTKNTQLREAPDHTEDSASSCMPRLMA